MTVSCEFWLPLKPKKVKPLPERAAAAAGAIKKPEEVLAALPNDCEKMQKPSAYEKMLNLFNTRLLDFGKKNTLVFPGRYVLHVEKVSPLEISREFAEAQTSEDGQSAPTAASILTNLFGSQSLDNLLVVLTPTAQAHKGEAVVHGFELDTMEHLGATIMEDSEWEQIELTHDGSTFQVIFCSGYLALEDVSEPTLIRETLQDLQQQAFKEIQIVPYDETLLSLYYRRSAVVQDEDETKAAAVQSSESSEPSDDISVRTSRTYTLMPFKGHGHTQISQALRMASRLAKQKDKYKRPNPMKTAQNPLLWPPAEYRHLNMHAVGTLRKDFAIQLHSQQMYNMERKWNSCFSQNSKRRNIFI